jgi:ketosteroid isomerase-like protein
MSDQENRDTVERYFQALARHDLDTLDALLHDDYVEEYHSIKHGGDLRYRRAALRVR